MRAENICSSPFLSPALGHRQQETLQRIADRIHWRIRIAPGVNQNAIQSIAQQICRAHQVELRKLPSYLPGTQSLVLKTVGAGGEMEVICREIEEATGISCRVSSE